VQLLLYQYCHTNAANAANAKTIALFEFSNEQNPKHMGNSGAYMF